MQGKTLYTFYRVSGVLDDAIQYLGLEEGDRIGHGTALGISPDTWFAAYGTSSANAGRTAFRSGVGVGLLRQSRN